MPFETVRNLRVEPGVARCERQSLSGGRAAGGVRRAPRACLAGPSSAPLAALIALLAVAAIAGSRAATAARRRDAALRRAPARAREPQAGRSSRRRAGAAGRAAAIAGPLRRSQHDARRLFRRHPRPVGDRHDRGAVAPAHHARDRRRSRPRDQPYRLERSLRAEHRRLRDPLCAGALLPRARARRRSTCGAC